MRRADGLCQIHFVRDAFLQVITPKFKDPSFHNWQGLWLADFQAMDFGFPFLYSSQACRI